MAHLKTSNALIREVELDSPTLITPALGTPSAGVMTNMTGAVTGSLVDNAVSLAKMAGGIDGNIISFDASGDPVAVATGTDGQVLTSTGAGSPPAFEALPGGGRVLQVKTGEGLAAISLSTTNYQVMDGVTVDITPASSANKVLCMIHANFGVETFIHGRIRRINTDLQNPTGQGQRPFGSLMTGQGGGGAEMHCISAQVLDSPATTGATTYALVTQTQNGGGNRMNSSMRDNNTANADGRASSSIVVMEIEG